MCAKRMTWFDLYFQHYPTKQFNYSKSEIHVRGPLKQKYSRCGHDMEPLVGTSMYTPLHRSNIVLSLRFTSA